MTASGATVSYVYDGLGRKLRSTNGIDRQTRDYIDGIEYSGTRDYWTNGTRSFDHEVMDQLNDQARPVYRDGALGGYFGLGASSVGLGKYNANNYRDRINAGYDQGQRDAGTIVNNLAKNVEGEIIESIKIVTHSMGGVR